jgi:hypothetical protein
MITTSRISPILAAAIAVVVLCGCSGNYAQVPTTPSQQSLGQTLDQPQTGHFLWGVWECSIDPETQKVEVAAMRGADFHVNLAGHLKPPNISIHVNKFYPSVA